MQAEKAGGPWRRPLTDTAAPAALLGNQKAVLVCNNDTVLHFGLQVIIWIFALPSRQRCRAKLQHKARERQSDMQLLHDCQFREIGLENYVTIA